MEATRLFLLLALFIAATCAANAQLTTADIVGTVTDVTGAVVPNAAVVVNNLGTNETRSGQSNASGEYTFTLLPVGHYSITVKAKGFQASVTKDLAVEAGDRARADVHLQLGSETTIIEVNASTPAPPGGQCHGELHGDSPGGAGSAAERSQLRTTGAIGSRSQ